MDRNQRITTLFFLGSSFAFALLAVLIFILDPYFDYWSCFFNLFSVVSMISYVYVGFKLDYKEDLKEFLVSVAWPSILSCIFWVFLLFGSLSGGGNGMLGRGIVGLLYYPVVSHSLLILNLFKGVVEANIFLLLPLNFLPILWILLGIQLQLRFSPR